MSRRTHLTLPLTLLLLASGCGGNGGPIAGTTSPAPPATSASTPTPTPTPPPASPGSPTPVPTPQLEDGKHFGYIRSVGLSTQPATMVFDLAYFLTGEDAVQAAKEHGDEYPPPNDYYIVNDNPKLRTLPLAPEVKIRLIDWGDCCETFFTADPEAFAGAFTTPDPTGQYQGPNSTYWIWVQGGGIVKIQEQYLP